MAQMAVVIDRYPTAVHFYVSRFQRLKGFLVTSKGVVKTKRHRDRGRTARAEAFSASLILRLQYPCLGNCLEQDDQTHRAFIYCCSVLQLIIFDRVVLNIYS